MHQSELRTVRRGGGDHGSGTSPPRQSQEGQPSNGKAATEVSTKRRLTTLSVRELVGQLKSKGEPLQTPLSDVPIPNPPACEPSQLDWPGMLMQALRDDHWRIAQVELVGKVECPSPSPIRVLCIGGIYEVTDRQYQKALQILGADEADKIRQAIRRETPSPSDYPSAMALWQVLAEQGWLAQPV